MKLRHLVLVGTVVVAFAAALLTATPSIGKPRHASATTHLHRTHYIRHTYAHAIHRTYAHVVHHTYAHAIHHTYARVIHHTNYRANSTPQERAQTRALNHRVAREGGLTDTGETGVQARQENLVARQRYSKELGGYKLEQQQYATEMGLYHARVGYYYLHRREPAEWWGTQYAAASPEAVNGLTRSDLVGAEIDEPDGRVVGQIIDLHSYPAAHVARIEVALKGGGTAWVDSTTLRYDAADRVMFTDVSTDDIRESSEPESEYPSR